MSFWVYILASQRNGTLYTGSTDDLGRRVAQHKAETLGGFTAQYGVKMLVWWEHPTRDSAFRRERRIKKWNRQWKLALIERFNPGWRDLFDEFTGLASDPLAEAARFLGELDSGWAAANEKSLGPRLRGDERDDGEGACPNS